MSTTVAVRRGWRSTTSSHPEPYIRMHRIVNYTGEQLSATDRELDAAVAESDLPHTRGEREEPELRPGPDGGTSAPLAAGISLGQLLPYGDGTMKLVFICVYPFWCVGAYLLLRWLMKKQTTRWSRLDRVVALLLSIIPTTLLAVFLVSMFEILAKPDEEADW